MGHVWAEFTDYSTGSVSAPTEAFAGSAPIAISTSGASTITAAQQATNAADHTQRHRYSQKRTQRYTSKTTAPSRSRAITRALAQSLAQSLCMHLPHSMYPQPPNIPESHLNNNN